MKTVGLTFKKAKPENKDKAPNPKTAKPENKDNK